MKGFKEIVTAFLFIQTLAVVALYLHIAEMKEDLSIYLDIYERKFNEVINATERVYVSVENFRFESRE